MVVTKDRVFLFSMIMYDDDLSIETRAANRIQYQRLSQFRYGSTCRGSRACRSLLRSQHCDGNERWQTDCIFCIEVYKKSTRRDMIVSLLFGQHIPDPSIAFPIFVHPSIYTSRKIPITFLSSYLNTPFTLCSPIFQSDKHTNFITQPHLSYVLGEPYTRTEGSPTYTSSLIT